MCKTILPDYNIAKIIKIDHDFPVMNYDHKMYCHLFMVHSIKCANCQPQCFACQ